MRKWMSHECELTIKEKVGTDALNKPIYKDVEVTTPCRVDRIRKKVYDRELGQSVVNEVDILFFMKESRVNEAEELKNIRFKDEIGDGKSYRIDKKEPILQKNKIHHYEVSISEVT